MLSSQEEQIERRRVFAQDQSLPKQATTFHQFAQADANTPRGRFSAVDAAYVIGSKPDVASAYPAGPAWCADPGSQLLEPPLGLDNPALEPSAVFSSVEDSAPVSEVPSSSAHAGDVERNTGARNSRNYRRF
jgi:hypothetical protein